MNQNQSNHKHSTTRAFIICLLLIAGLFSTAIFSSSADAKSKSDSVRLVPESFSSIAETAGPAVITIRTEKTIKGGGQVFRYFFRGPQEENDPMWDLFNRFYGNPRQREYKQQSLGSGFIIDEDGYIIKEINNLSVKSIEDFETLLKETKSGESIRVLITRMNTGFMVIQLTK